MTKTSAARPLSDIFRPSRCPSPCEGKSLVESETKDSQMSSIPCPSMTFVAGAVTGIAQSLRLSSTSS